MSCWLPYSFKNFCSVGVPADVNTIVSIRVVAKTIIGIPAVANTIVSIPAVVGGHAVILSVACC